MGPWYCCNEAIEDPENDILASTTKASNAARVQTWCEIHRELTPTELLLRAPFRPEFTLVREDACMVSIVLALSLLGRRDALRSFARCLRGLWSCSHLSSLQSAVFRD